MFDNIIADASIFKMEIAVQGEAQFFRTKKFQKKSHLKGVKIK